MESDKIHLKNFEAVQLWQSGKEKWNAWVAENPEANIDFSEIDFRILIRKKKTWSIDFSEFHFPKGNIDFSQSKFPDVNVDFSKAHFAGGKVHFDSVRFEGGLRFYMVNMLEGDFNFSSVKVNGNVDFASSNFGTGRFLFKADEFKDGKIDFRHVNFGDGDFEFCLQEKGEGDVSFYQATFGKGDKSFNSTRWGEGEVTFYETFFSDGKVDFTASDFGSCIVSFHKTNFGNGDTTFENIRSYTAGVEHNIHFVESSQGTGLFSFNLNEKCTVECLRFENANFGGNVKIDVFGSDYITGFNFRGTAIKGWFVLRGQFGCIPDLRDSELSRNVALHEVYLKPSIKSVFYRWPQKGRRIGDGGNEAKLTKLKEIAEINKHHSKALEFHAWEMRAKRWRTNGVLRSFLDGMFSLTSDYGQSILRPTAFYFSINLVFFAVYLAFAQNALQKCLVSLVLSTINFTFSNSLPFIQASKRVKDIWLEKTYPSPETVPEIVFSLMGVHGVLSFVCLFLIGLGLRNVFRI